MQPSTAAFAAALTQSHVAVSLATVNAALSDVPLATLAVISGTVTVDDTRAVRRTCTLTLQDPTGQLVPADVSDLLHPLSGNELHLWRGLRLASPIAYASLVGGNGPSAYWQLGETSGTTAIDAAGAHAGTYGTGVTLGAPGLVLGDPDRAVTFDGSTAGGMVVPAAADLSVSDFTVSMLVKPAASQPTIVALLDHDHAASGPGKGWVVQSQDGGATFYLGWWDGAAYQVPGVTGNTGPLPVTPGAVQHLAFVKSGPTITYYKNGAFAGSFTAAGSTGIIGYGGALRLRLGGAVSITGREWAGTMDEVAHFPGALSASQVASLAAAALRTPATTTSDELIPLGVFGISKPTIKDTASGLEISLTGNDRSQTIARAQWIDPWAPDPDALIPDAIRALLLDRWPGLSTFNLAPSDYTVPAGTIFGLDQSSNPMANAQTLATVGGQEAFFDAQGIPTSRPITDPDTSPVVATYAEGENATFVEIDRDLDESRAYNAVVVTSQPADGSTPLRSVVPAVLPSPLAPYFYSSALITTQAQCDATAAGLLLSLRNAVEEVTFTAVPDPRLDSGDIVMLIRARSRLAAPHRVQAVTMPVDPDSLMQVTCSPRQAA